MSLRYSFYHYSEFYFGPLVYVIKAPDYHRFFLPSERRDENSPHLIPAETIFIKVDPVLCAVALFLRSLPHSIASFRFHLPLQKLKSVSYPSLFF